MKKILSFTIAVTFIISMISSGVSHKVYAEENSKIDSKFEQALDSITLSDIELYFTKSISELESEKQKTTSDEEKKNIDCEIKSLTNTLATIKSENLTDEDIELGKNLISNITKVEKTIPGDSLTRAESKAIVPVPIVPVNPSYVTIKAAILATIALGDSSGYDFSAKLLAHSLSATPNSTYHIYNNDKMVTNRVKVSKYYKAKLNEYRNIYKNTGKTYYVIDENSFSFDGDKNLLVESDMYYAIHGLHKSYLNISKSNNTGTFTLNDVYDFPGVKFPSSFSDVMNDLGSMAVKFGVCHVYNISIHTTETFEGQTSTYVSYPGYYLKYGSRGYYVELVQKRLNELGFYCGSVDGIFGSNTKAKVQAFQRSKGLSADGIVGPSTWSALKIKS